MTTKEDFNSVDTEIIGLLLNTVAAAFAIGEKEPGKDFSGKLSAESALDILSSYPEYAPEMMININSPGDISAYNRFLVPLVAAAMLTLALSDGAEAAPQQIKVVNSVAPADPCSVTIDAKVKETINMMGYESWQAQCRRLRATRDKTGLKPQSFARVVPRHHQP